MDKTKIMLNILDPHKYFTVFPYDGCNYSEEEYYRQAKILSSFNELLSLGLQGNIAPSGRCTCFPHSVLYLDLKDTIDPVSNLKILCEELSKYNLLKEVYHYTWLGLK